ncbi:hypothetical protein [Mesorhizobium sp.]|uniref:hypothetical protein n=1 Tax=Mesorhizobium sp. TaxID=1871066 RepID=UPI000FE7A63A|nr:hypothetical protein [Mesorhizobium sp.]RWN58457.1 MAG: hypothetical protein EOS00_21235 [Mesorhizobium sp.]
MDDQSAQIATICECIDHCFAFAIWCNDFANSVDPEDMMWGLDRGFDLVSDATRLQSFLALRKLDDFFGGVKPKPDDLVASNFNIDMPDVLGEVGESFLTQAERTDINKGVAHLTERLSLDPDSEVDLKEIVNRSIPVFSRLVVALRAVDAQQEAAHWLDRTEALIERGQAR